MKEKYPYEKYHKNINNELYKLCPGCENWFPCLDEYFYKSPNNKKDGLTPFCKICYIEINSKRQKEQLKQRLEYQKERRKTNPKEDRTKSKRYRSKDVDKVRRIRNQWTRNNKDKLNKYTDKKHNVTEQEWEDCKRYFNYQCAYCGLSLNQHYITYKGITKLGDFHKEHIIDEGKNDLKNCVPSCKECNSEKREKSFGNWYNCDNIKYSKERYHKIYMWIRYDCKKFIQPKKK